MRANAVARLLQRISICNVCQIHLPHKPKPILSVGPNCKILIIGQAPGQKVHDSEIPWDDLSGNELRRWLGVDKETFYSTDNFGFMPMGFCFPGKGKSGDLPPRQECAPLWHNEILKQMKRVELILLIGQYSQSYYLKETAEKNVTETVRNFENYLPKYLPLVHPSPRNKIWQKRNGWFEKTLVPELRKRIGKILE
jgi:uracil-DNA glycosylase